VTIKYLKKEEKEEKNKKLDVWLFCNVEFCPFSLFKTPIQARADVLAVLNLQGDKVG